LGVLALAGLLLGSSVPRATEVLAAPPDGITINHRGYCVVRSGGHGGFRIDHEFDWFYSDQAQYGPQVTLSGQYGIELHNPTSDQYETLSSFPYGFGLLANTIEPRAGRTSPRDPHWVFDKIRLSTTWSVEELGVSGREVTEIACDVEPPPEGQQPISGPTANSAAGPQDSENFVYSADPSPFSGLGTDSWLLCFNRNGGKQEIHWGFRTLNNSIGGDGVASSGNIRLSLRSAGGEYHVVHEEPFGFTVALRELNTIDGYLASRDNFSAKLEVDWQASLGTRVEPGARVQHIVRTIACAPE
jgi:hypothetical protein